MALAVAAIAVAWCLTPASLLAQPQTGNSEMAPQAAPTCLGKIVQKIEFPGVSETDQQTLRNMLPIHQGEALARAPLQQSLRVLFATGRFAELRAECDRSADGQVLLTFANTSNFFVGSVSVEGAPGRPSESQIVNASKLQLGEVFTSEKLDRALTNVRRLMEENDLYR